MNKFQKSLVVIVDIVFALLMLCILFSTIIIDKNIDSFFLNSLNTNNAYYYLIALILVIIIVLIDVFLLKNKDISNKYFNIILVVVFFVVAVLWQYPVSLWINPDFTYNDFGNVANATIGLSVGKTFLDFPYFSEHPNNANLVIALSFLLRIFKNWRIIIFIGQLSTNLAAIFVSLSVRKVTKNNKLSIFVLLLAELIMALTWRANLVYTDNFVMIFIALLIYIYLLDIKKGKFIYLTIIAAIAYFIKASSLVVYLAMIFTYIIKGIYDKDLLIQNIKSVIKYLLIIFVVFGITKISQQKLQEHYMLNTSNSYPRSWQHMFLVGQNTNSLGAVNGEDNNIIVEAMENGYDNSYVKRKEFEVAINRIKERGIINNIDFYLKKLDVVFGDGYFHNVQIGFDDNTDDRTNFFYNVYNKENGKNYIVGASVLQVSFFVILAILTVGSIITNKDDALVFFKLTIIGVIVFVLLFEGRSKYLYMFLPVFTITAGLLLNKIMFRINNTWRK